MYVVVSAMRMLTEVWLDHKHGFDMAQTKHEKEDAIAAAHVQQNVMTGRRPKTPEGKGTKRNQSPLLSACSSKSDQSDRDKSGMAMGSIDWPGSSQCTRVQAAVVDRSHNSNA